MMEEVLVCLRARKSVQSPSLAKAHVLTQVPEPGGPGSGGDGGGGGGGGDSVRGVGEAKVQYARRPQSADKTRADAENHKIKA